MHIAISRAIMAVSAVLVAGSPALAGPRYKLSPQKVAAAHGSFYPVALTDYGLAAGTLAATDGTISAYYSEGKFFSDDDFCAALGDPGGTAINGISRDSALTYTVGTCNGEHFSYIYNQAANTTTAVSYPGAVSTFAYGVNANGVAVGEWFGSGTHGFSLYNGTYNSITVPGAYYTVALGVTAQNTIFGNYYTESPTNYYGFVLGANGALTTINYPGSTYVGMAGLNSQNMATGFYEDATNHQYAFAWQNGTYFVLKLKGALDTRATAINESGIVTGWYLDASSNEYGFVWQPATGKVILVKGPAGSKNLEVTGINDTNAQITCMYTSSAGHDIGFIGSCTGTGCF